ncbi:MAG: carbohydrate kinase family protein [Blautia faecis]
MASSVDYYVLTQLLIDDIYLPSGEHHINQLGGGIYAVAGMRIWSNHVGFCCAPGPDYEGNYDSWFINNQIEISGGRRDKKCTHARLNYFPDGEREELLLPDCASHHESQPLISEIPANYKNCKGMYFFKDCEESFWNDLLPFLRSGSSVSCWEIFGASACQENRDFIGDVLHDIDLFSFNLTEGKRLTGKSDPVDIVKELFKLNAKNVILRMGAKGALVSSGKQIYLIPAAPTNVVDVTGGGNSSTGGLVTGFCQSDGDIVEAGLCAGISASYILQQYGVPPVIDSTLMADAHQKLNNLRSHVTQLV